MSRLEEIEARKVEIKSEVESTEEVEKLEELNNEVDALNEEAQQITEAEEQNEVAESLEEQPEVKAKATEVSMEVKKEENVMEMRNTKEYIDAYAEYIKTEKDDEIRSLLTENVSGSIAVPDFVLDEVKTAWDNNELLSKVRKTNIKGNLRVQFEISGSDAVIHTEGAYAVDEEELVDRAAASKRPRPPGRWLCRAGIGW